VGTLVRSLGPSARSLVAFAAVLTVGVMVCAGATATFSLPRPGTSLTASAAGANSTHSIQHVVVIVLENEGLKSVWAYAPYENYLVSTYGNATQDFAACHPSAPNYLAMISTETNQCGSDNWNNYTNRTLGNLLQADGFSWANYAESLPANACSAPGSATHGSFATRHVPFLFMANVLAKPSYCRSHVLDSSVFNSSLANGSLRNFSFYTPNLCDDGHTGCGGNVTTAQLTQQGDSWLRDFLSPILNHTGRYSSPREQAVINHTAFIITFDEGSSTSYLGYAVKGIASGEDYGWCQSQGSTGDAVCGGHIYLAIVSPFSVHLRFTGQSSQASIVTTVEWLFGLGKLRNPGNYDAGGKFPPMKSLFSFGSNGY